jgi:2-hydroxychromene-2-carboxylate isomerase
VAIAVRFWVDPACPWCWVTSQWIRDIAADRDLVITWEPISLMVKNQTPKDSPFFDVVSWTYGLLRVMEAVRATQGDAPLGPLYRTIGRRIHNEGERLWDPGLALEEVGLDVAYAAAADDSRWDAEVARRHDEGLALVGQDVGTPIISIVTADGVEKATFGPVITKVPAKADALALWDALVTLTTLEEFWELKRTRTTGPEFIDEG